MMRRQRQPDPLPGTRGLRCPQLVCEEGVDRLAVVGDRHRPGATGERLRRVDAEGRVNGRVKIGDRHRPLKNILGQFVRRAVRPAVTVVSGSEDTTVMVWRIFGDLPGIDLSANDVQAFWNDLAGTDAARAYQQHG